MIGLCLADRYEITAELGHGGMATVYRAADRVLGRDVAVKVVSTRGLKEAAIERFQREARLVGRLDHPAVVPIYDFGRDDERLFFVMPVLEGDTLHRLLRDNPPSLAQTLEILARVAEALDHSASRGVVHRDVKPENIMVSIGGGPGADSIHRVWVMDFGLALSRATTRLTKAGNLPGTLAYLSPEQVLAADSIDGRSDLYSLGVILYECLFGRPPFSGAAASVLYRIVHELPKVPESAAIDPLLLELLHLCLEKKPSERIQSGGDLARALREVALQVDASGPVAVGTWRRRGSGRAPQLPLIGRDQELAQLRRALDRALPGELQLLLVSGHPGLGKTRMLEALEDEARGRGAIVLRGRFAERESTYPYQAFCELILDYFRQRKDGSLISASRSSPRPSRSSSTSRSSVSRSSGGQQTPMPDQTSMPDLTDLAADLLTVFPALSEIPAVRDAAQLGAAPAELDEAAMLYELVAKTLARLGEGRATVLVLEQLDAADASIALIQYLLRRLSSAPVLLAASYRPTSVGRRHPLVRLIQGLRDDPRFHDLRLGPLPAEAHGELVEELLGAPAERELTDKIFEATEGNPFFTRELLQAMLETGGVVLGEGGEFRSGNNLGSSEDLLAAGDLPEAIQQAVEARLERLQERPRRVLEAASVLGRRMTERELEELLPPDDADGEDDSAIEIELNHETLELALDTLLDLGLLEEDRTSRRGDRLRFASGLVRDVVYSRLPRRRRRRLHLRRADAILRRAGKRLDRVAHDLLHHYGKAGAVDPTIRFGLIYARRSLAAYCWDDTLYACALALEFLAERPDEETAYVHADDSADDSANTGARRNEAELRHLRARALAAKGLLQGAQTEGRRAFDLLRKTGAAESQAVDVAIFLAETAWRARRVDETRAWLDRGLELARGAGEPARDAQVSLLRLGAKVSNLAGEVEEAQEFLAEADRLQANRLPDLRKPRLSPGGTLRLAMTRSFTGLDPTSALSAQDVEIARLLYEPLLRPDSEGGFEPCLGSSWSRTDDGLAYRFAIDTRRKFTDGSPLTAGVVKRSLEQAAAMTESRRPAALDAIVAIETPADDELLLRIDRPLAPFPALLSDPRTGVALRSEESAEPRGTGPFRLSRRTSSFLVLSRNASHPKPPLVETLEVEFFEHSHEIAGAWRRRAVQSEQQLDMARDLSPADVTEFQRRGGPDRLVETPQNNVYFVLLNPNGPRLKDPELRRIVATSVDARELVWRVVPRFANPLVGWLPPGVAGHDPGRDAEIVARDEAVQAMDAYRPLPVRLRAIEVPSFTDQYRPVSDTLCDTWRLLGIEVERQTVKIAEFAHVLQDASSFDLVFARWWPDYFDPDGFFFGAFHSAAGLFRACLSTRERDAAGGAEYDAPTGSEWDTEIGTEIDTQIDRARRHDEPEERVRLYRQLEQRLLGEHLVRPLFHDVEYRLVSPRVAGLETYPNPPFVNYSRLGLRKQSPAAEVERRAGRLVVPLGSRVDTLDPAWSFHADAAEVTANIFESLTRLDEAAVAVPHLAESLEPEDGARAWRVKLCEARFHDGRRLTARDVRFSFHRLLRAGSPDLRLFLASLEGAEEAMEGRGDLPGVRIVGDRQLELRLNRPMPHFPALLSNAATAILPEGTEEFGPTWRHGTAGTGPFQLVAFQPGRRVDLVAYGDYRRPGLPKVAELVFELGIAPRRAAEGFSTGQFSILSTLAAEDLEAFSRRPEFAAGLVEQPSFTTYFATLTAVRGPLADPQRRRLVAGLLADLRPRLAARLGRLGQPAGRLIPPSFLGLSDPAANETGGTSTLAPTATDPLLDGIELKVALHPSYGAGFRRLWREIRGALETAGLRLIPTQADIQEILQMTAEGELDLVFNRWIADYPDPSSFTQVLTAGPAAGQWREPQLERIARRAQVEDDRQTRRSLFLEFEALLAERAFLVPLFHEQSWRLVRPGIGGLRLRYGWPEVVYEELKIRS